MNDSVPTERRGERPGVGTQRVSFGDDCRFDAGVTVGRGHSPETGPTVVGDDAVVRSGTVIYHDVSIGDRLRTGHNVLVREHSHLGDDVVVGTNTIVDGHVEIGSRVSLQSGVYLPPGTVLGDDVFVGPNAVFTNDPYPVRVDVDLVGATVEDHVSVGANATIMPGVTLGEGCFVAGGAVVTRDVPPRTLAVGTPATHRPLPEPLQGENHLG
jgi:acetyltransferase-like isoleucine patch superfamily enzyme